MERLLLSNFSKYASIDDPSISSSVWRQMILGQHHGLPTRLLDWTHSIFVALHFAVTESDYSSIDKNDCVIWKIDLKELDERLPEKYKKLLVGGSGIFSTDLLCNSIHSLNDYDETMREYNSMIVLEPPSIDERIVNQYSFFTIVPSHVNDIEKMLEEMKSTTKYIIKSSLRWYIRDLLDQNNISERTIYPGLDGTAKWLGRRYFVKREK